MDIHDFWPDSFGNIKLTEQSVASLPLTITGSVSAKVLIAEAAMVDSSLQ